jgi:peptide/nickel transport system permease protein
MTRYLLRRLAHSLVTLILIISIVFVIVSILPGDVGRQIAGPFAPQKQVDDLNEKLGTNDPLIVQYGRLLKDTATFDFGDSFELNRPAASIVGSAFLRSIKLAAYALLLTIPISIAAGVYAARKRGGRSDRAIVSLGLASSSIPDFVSGVILASLIGVTLGWFHVIAQAPEGSGFFTQVSYLTLPAIALVIVYFGYIARMTRAGVGAALDADYTRTAVMKGLSQRRVLQHHVLRNGLQPTVAVIGVQIGYILGSLVAIEKVFNYPGVGLTIVNAAGDKDLPVLVAGVLLVAIVYMVATLVADLIIAWMNPRARLAAEG